MIKVNQHALINLVYSYMGTKVFNIQPVLFHQCYLCHLWFKKQSFTLVWKSNPPLRLCTLRARCWCSECRLYPRKPRAECASLHVISEIWLCYNVAVALQRGARYMKQQKLWSSRPCICTSVDHRFFFTWEKKWGGGGVVRLTAKPRYCCCFHPRWEKIQYRHSPK